MSDQFDKWLLGAPVIDMGGLGDFSQWESGAPLVSVVGSPSVATRTFTLTSDARVQVPIPIPVPPPNQPNCFFTVNARGYAARFTLPQPLDDCNGMTHKPIREFHECQFQILWTGHCVVRRFATHIKMQTVPSEGSCPPQVACVGFPFCDDNLFTYDSHPGAFNVPVLADQRLCASVGFSFSQDITASGGIPPYIFSTPGGMIAGFTGTQTGPLTFNVSSAIVPTYATVPFTLKVTDAAGQIATATISVVMAGAMSEYAHARVGVPYSSGQADFNPQGGVAPYTVAFDHGVLPPGLTFASDGSGTISGTPTDRGPGSFDFFIITTDALGCTAESEMVIFVDP